SRSPAPCPAVICGSRRTPPSSTCSRPTCADRGPVRLVTVAIYRLARVFTRSARVLNHLAAGTERVADLRIGIEDVWERTSPTDAEIAAGLMDWEEEVVRRFVRADDRVLLVGSGSGRDFIPLVARGHRVTGVEPARRAIATARRHLAERGLSADIVEGFFEDV